jgi:hypothetical protein
VALGAAFVQFFTTVTPAVPILMQVGLCLWFVLYWQIDSLRA